MRLIVQNKAKSGLNGISGQSRHRTLAVPLLGAMCQTKPIQGRGIKFEV
jgi:hypothetical protein